MAADTNTWEQSAAFALDSQPSVERWVNNEHPGLRVPYGKGGVPASHLPDFIAVLLAGLRLLIEIKGQYGDDADLKAKAARRWTAAVTGHGGFDTWQYVVIQDPPALTRLLDELAPQNQPALALS
ncbi:MAG: hypothetical protein LJE69_13420 [Thiohalocapsa sp.]|jgi:type III restriction enzyme|uniref:hypothetical protein n=1 Tax=Thiohalocapsa sp. TaxID=2497641 RepID=UPI0026002D30|nr:hypothetical protein [Thiohalocapsa sp.]MCG6942237.1 hypothetical protein [Thiohalocapsa sp.]